MSTSQGIAPGKNPIWALAFLGQVHRYKTLLSKFWWVVLLTVSLAVCAVAWYQIQKPPTYLSAGTLSVNVENPTVTVGQQNNSNFNQGLEQMLLNQIDILKASTQVRQNTMDNLAARYPDMPPIPVSLDYIPHNSFLTISATGANPIYTQRYLKALLDGYLTYRHQTRNDLAGTALNSIGEQIQHMEDVLKKDDDEIVKYQHDNGVVFQKNDTSGGALADLKKRRADLQEHLDQLTLMTPEQGLDHGTSRRVTTTEGGSDQQNALEASNQELEYRNARTQIVALQAQRADWSRDLRPKHPKIVAFDSQIKVYEQQIANLLEYSRKRLDYMRTLDESKIKLADQQIKEAEQSKFGNDILRVGYDNLQEQKRRDESTYDNLKKTMSEGTVGNITNQDPIKVSDTASPAVLVPINWVKSLALALVAGLALGVGILLLLENLDDRMGTVSDFQTAFSEQVIGQIPRDESGDNTEMLRPDDQRHQLVESFRNLRSTLLYLPIEGKQPKTLLVTSAVPNEGKSTLSMNLALIMAFAGKKTLLIDADLRRGAIHQSFGVTRDPGLTDVLGHNVNWKIAIRTTGIENLHVLPRGRNVPQPSEYILKSSTDQLLRDLYDLYDYIIIDSSPILAADDTASLAPKIDATLFVVRLSYTSAKLTRKSLEVLYKRGANVPGVILNQVDTKSPEFVYYQYQEYYHTARDEDDNGGSSAGTGTLTKPKPTVDVS